MNSYLPSFCCSRSLSYILRSCGETIVAVYDRLFLVDHFNPMIIHIIKMERETIAVVPPSTAKRIMLVLPTSLLEGMVITISFAFAVVITMDIMVVDRDVVVALEDFP